MKNLLKLKKISLLQVILLVIITIVAYSSPVSATEAGWPKTPCLWGGPIKTGWQAAKDTSKLQPPCYGHLNNNKITIVAENNAQVSGSFNIYGVNGDIKKLNERREITITVEGSNVRINGTKTNAITVSTPDYNTNPYNNRGLGGGTKNIRISGNPINGRFVVTAVSPSTKGSQWLGGFKGDSVVLGPISYSFTTTTPTPTPVQIIAECKGLEVQNPTSNTINKNERAVVKVLANNANAYRVYQLKNNTNTPNGKPLITSINSTLGFNASPNIRYRFEVRNKQTEKWVTSNSCIISWGQKVVPTPTPTPVEKFTPASVSMWGDPYTTYSNSFMTQEIGSSTLLSGLDGVVKPRAEWTSIIPVYLDLKNGESIVFRGLKYKNTNSCELHVKVSQVPNQLNNEKKPLEHITEAALHCSTGSLHAAYLGHYNANLGYKDIQVNTTGNLQIKNIIYYHTTAGVLKGVTVKVDGIEYMFVQQPWGDNKNYSGLVRIVTDETVNPAKLEGYFSKGLRGENFTNSSYPIKPL